MASASPQSCELAARLENAEVRILGAESAASCVCKPGFYNAAPPNDGVVCRQCPVGTDCSAGAVTLETLPLRVGNYRTSPYTIDVRRCPDAADNCGGLSECEQSSSGCRGGNGSSPCAPGLMGPFCRLCNESSVNLFYVPASGATMAHCERCQETWGATAAILGAIVAGVVLGVVMVLRAYRHLSPKQQSQLSGIHHTLTLHNKAKVLIGFYQIASKIGYVYEVRLTSDLQHVLDQISAVLTLGIDIGLESLPLRCFGLPGYSNSMLFWLLLPIVLSTLIYVLVPVWQRTFRWVRKDTVLAAAPAVLRLLFLCYPVVTREAFEAFSCYEFDDGRRWLRADVSIECGTEAHKRAQRMAVAAIIVYPCGLPVAFGALLLRSRRSIVSLAPDDPLKSAIAFLHREFKTEFYLWELAEMVRRFLLVGVFMRLKRGSVEQLMYGTMVSIIFAIVHAVTSPMRNASDNLLSTACNLLLAMLFVVCIDLKYGALTQLTGIQTAMTLDQQNRYTVPHILLSAICLLCCVGALIVLVFIVAVQVLGEIRRSRTVRRLCFEKTHTQVAILHLPSTLRYHVFLSHRWANGQDQARVIKQRLLEMLPGIAVFLDVDDLQRKRGKGAELVRSCQHFLLFCSAGFFDSEPCMKELLCALREGVPIITVIEPMSTHGGLQIDKARRQLSIACHIFSQCGWWTELLDQPWSFKAIDKAVFLQHEPIEWARIGDLADVTMRLIATRLLKDPSQPTYLQGELTHRTLGLPSWCNGPQVYHSRHNHGCGKLLEELMDAAAGHATFRLTDDENQLGMCGVMLLYLHAQTWSAGSATSLEHNVAYALENQIPLLLAHEDVGIYHWDATGMDSITFQQLEEATPLALCQSGIYSEIATSLKGGSLRKTSLLQLLHALAHKLKERGKAPVHAPLGFTAWWERHMRAHGAAHQQGDQDKDLRAAQAEAQQTLTLKPLSPHTQAISLFSTHPWPGSPGPGLQWPHEPPMSECSQASESWAAAPEKPVTSQPDKEAQLPKIQTLDEEVCMVLSGHTSSGPVAMEPPSKPASNEPTGADPVATESDVIVPVSLQDKRGGLTAKVARTRDRLASAQTDVANAQAVVSKVDHELKQLLARQGEVPPADSALQALLPVRCPSPRLTSERTSQGKLSRTLSKDMARELRSHRVEEGTATERRRTLTSRPGRRTSRKSAGPLTA